MALSPEVESIRKNNWTSGSIFSVDDSKKYTTKEGGYLPGGDYLVISQICDIVTPSLENEPYVEVISIRYISEINNSFTKRKSHKKLHIELDALGFVEICSMDRYIIKRESFIKFQPDNTINKKTIKSIVNWITKKLLRDPFPDNFMKLIKRDKFKKILEKSHECIENILFKLDNDTELPEGECYKLSILLLIQDDTKTEDIKKIKEVLEDIVKFLSSINSIEIVSDMAEKGMDLTMSLYYEYKEFYFDDLSS